MYVEFLLYESILMGWTPLLLQPARPKTRTSLKFLGFCFGSCSLLIRFRCRFVFAFPLAFAFVDRVRVGVRVYCPRSRLLVVFVVRVHSSRSSSASCGPPFAASVSVVPSCADMSDPLYSR